MSSPITKQHQKDIRPVNKRHPGIRPWLLTEQVDPGVRRGEEGRDMGKCRERMSGKNVGKECRVPLKS